MKKRILALLLALCVSSVNVMGAFATAPEGTTTEEALAVEDVEESLSADGNDDEQWRFGESAGTVRFL